jgi:hypothetical protein
VLTANTMISLDGNNKNQISDFLSSIDTFLFDMDGVLWHGNTLLDRIPETLDMLRKMVGSCFLFSLIINTIAYTTIRKSGQTGTVRNEQFNKVSNCICEKV